jgi:hypothetical protein
MPCSCMSNMDVDKSQQGFSNKADDTSIYVEFSDENGLRPVSLFTRKKAPELAQKSNDALNKAMDTIKEISQRVHSTVVNIERDKRPGHVEVEFGIKFDAEFGVIVAKLTAEASMTVTMAWDNADMMKREQD